MKVVLFCGGLGLRLYPETEITPKPLIPIGGKPLIWHIMKYYSHFGHKDFILCLGYKGELIKKYFLEQDGYLLNDFTISDYGKKKDIINGDSTNWTISFIDTGLHANIGQRLKSVQKYVEKDEVFLANYSDAVTELNLPELLDFFMRSKKTGCLLSVKPSSFYHTISVDSAGYIENIMPLSEMEIRINGGYFVFKNAIFDEIKTGEDLVNEPFQRLIKKRELLAYKYDGFWVSVDTFKDKQRLDDLESRGQAKWQIWNY